MARRRQSKPLAELVGLRIQTLRDQQDLSRTELARRASISLTNLVQIENGRVQTRLGTLEIIARTLGVRVAELVDSDAPAPPAPEKQSPALRRLLKRIQDHREDEPYLRALNNIAKTLETFESRA